LGTSIGVKMKNEYEFGKDPELDLIRTDKNISKMLKGQLERKNKKKKVKIFK
jgi:hypothetical protein